MIIPSIDIMGGKAVQLRQGKELVLTAERDPEDLAREFNRVGEVAVIDLDAALGQGDNLDLLRRLCRVADVRVGGGIRETQRGLELLKAGAKKIIVGTAADPEFLKAFPADRVMVAVDHVGGSVVDQGWTRETGEDLFVRAERLAPYCSAFLCTFVQDEGGMGGMDLEAVQNVAERISRPVTVAGGVASTDEVVALSKLGLDVQVGMGLYTGKIDPVEAVVRSVEPNSLGLVPTVVQDEAGQVLMLAYSRPDTLEMALRQAKGIYWSRSREEVWEKGLTSGNVQELLACRVDCDRDTVLFRVAQTGPACHRETYSCFGDRRFSLTTLFDVLKRRKADLPEGSFSAKMFEDRTRLLRKLMEESFEVTQARERRELVWEIADLLYFASLLAVDEGIEWPEIEAELGGRHK